MLFCDCCYFHSWSHGCSRLRCHLLGLGWTGTMSSWLPSNVFLSTTKRSQTCKVVLLLPRLPFLCFSFLHCGLHRQATMRAIWRQYVPDAHAILYVVDAAEPGRFAAARAELGTATPAITQQCSSTHAGCCGATLLPGHLPRQTVGCSRRAQYTCASVCQQTRLGCTSCNSRVAAARCRSPPHLLCITHLPAVYVYSLYIPARCGL